MEIKKVVIFGVINIAVGTLSGASGGAGSLISTPFMILLGLSPAQAIATAKFNGFGTSLGATSRFYHEKITDKRTVIIFSILGCFGAILGSITLLHFQSYAAQIQRIMGFFILFVGIPLLYVRKQGLVVRSTSSILKATGLFGLVALVFLQVALSSGIGSLQMLLLINCFGMTALVANATRRLMQLTVSTTALAIFISQGLVNYEFGFVGLITSLTGGFIGAHLAVKKGNKFIINIFALVSVILALQLIFAS